MVEVVEADGDAVSEDEGTPVLLFVRVEALLEILIGLEAAAQLHGRLHRELASNPGPGISPGSEVTPGEFPAWRGAQGS